jgi:hypothetical protein
MAVSLDRPPPGEPSRGFLGGGGTRLGRLMGGSMSLRAPRADRGACPLVSCRLHGFVGGVGDGAMHSLVRATPWSPRPWMLSGLVDA